ncbi:LOW QUALITY PROTEIN: hypothetical protein Cgig2_017681 [Carnegiea gigantea]|uniref:Uncharacterized protein n=1 Tax=Carnegiea gigantea TaxID=171969 RepID=A0A9Q1JM84_9CARY|nr:LOW QUALITY PROTEIN: hypothetical protein Cgig2_017681 [Carnegiea gigantea]
MVQIECRNVNSGLLGRIRDQGSIVDDEQVNSLDALGWAEAATFLLSALRILVDPTEEFKKITAKFLLTTCTEGNENKIYVEVASETCLWSKIEVGRRKEDSVAIGFGVVKGDEEDYIIDILKRRPLSLCNTLLSDYKNVVQCGVSTIYAPKKHVIKKQIEKGFKRHGEICNNVTLLTGAEQMQMMSIVENTLLVL